MTLALLTTLTALATDSRRPFYVIAHCANAPAQVERAIEAGANGVELDVMLLDGRLVVRHGGLEPRECGVRADDAPALLRQVASAMQAGELALLVVDTKRTEGRAGAVGHAVGEALTAAELPAERVVVSVPLDQLEAVRDGVHQADYAPRFDAYLSETGRSDVGPWLQALDDASLDVAGVGMDPIAFWRPMPWWTPWLEALSERSGLRYYWTVNRRAAVRDVLDHGLDGVITNHPARAVSVLHESPYVQAVRLASTTEPLP